MARKLKSQNARKRRNQQSIVLEHAAAYGVNLPAEPASSERYLSPNEIGKILNVTGEAVKQWIYRRRLPAVKLANGYWKVRVSDFEAFLRARNEVGRRHVLIAHTSEEGLKQIVEAVEKLGHTPIVAHNYPDAMLKALDHFPSLFIIHLAANDPESWKFAEKIRATKALRSFPILFVADAGLSDAELERALPIAAQGVLTRPLTTETLSREIDQILRRTV